MNPNTSKVISKSKVQSVALRLTDEQFEDLEKLAAIAFAPEKIAMYFGISETVFMEEFNKADSKIRFHFEKGVLQSVAKINMATLSRAKDGNLTSITQLAKEMQLQKVEISKKRRMYEVENKNYEKLQNLVEHGQVQGIPTQQLEYFEQLDYIRCLYNKYESKSFILHAVQLKWPELSKYKINKLFSDTLNFFYIDNEVKVEAYQNIYADFMDNMARICFDINDFETARRCTLDAVKIRGVGSDKKDVIPKEMMDRRPVVYTIKPTDVGIHVESRYKLAEFIDALPINSKEKLNAKRDAKIEDIEFTLMEEDEKD
jgi:hypothetical protein